MYGRAGTLLKLNKDRNSPKLSKFERLQADKAHQKIVNQMKDKKLMRMRLRLINATRAGDLYESSKIEQLMKDYLKEDRETGV
jgi:hypothetical protein